MELIVGENTYASLSDFNNLIEAYFTESERAVFEDLEDAAAHMVEETRCYEPRKDMHELYQKIYERYEHVYDAVRPLV